MQFFLVIFILFIDIVKDKDNVLKYNNVIIIFFSLSLQEKKKEEKINYNT